MEFVQDPFFYAVAVPAILLTGISKGGFAAGLGILTVPLMSLAVSPLTAAGIMLPILVVMDMIGLWAYRGKWDRANMRVLIPAAVVGIGFGALTAGMFDEATIRFVVGMVAIVFALNYWLGKFRRIAQSDRPPNRYTGYFWGAVSGFTSFVSHAGGPPVQVYLLPQQLDKTKLVATMVVFFAVVNFVKLAPYAWLGMLHLGNLQAALTLAPLAPVGMGLGIWLNKRISPVAFYQLCYTLTFVVGMKLVYDALAAV